MDPCPCTTCEYCATHFHPTKEDRPSHRCADCKRIFCTDCTALRLTTFPPTSHGQTECWFCSECPEHREYDDLYLLEHLMATVGTTRAALIRQLAREQFVVHPDKCILTHAVGVEVPGATAAQPTEEEEKKE